MMMPAVFPHVGRRGRLLIVGSHDYVPAAFRALVGDSVLQSGILVAFSIGILRRGGLFPQSLSENVAQALPRTLAKIRKLLVELLGHPGTYGGV